MESTDFSDMNESNKCPTDDISRKSTRNCLETNVIFVVIYNVPKVTCMVYVI